MTDGPGSGAGPRPTPGPAPGPAPGSNGAALAASAAEQLVDVVDEHGVITGRATRAEVRAGNLRHRSVFIAVVTSLDELVVHKRADWKDVWPSRWDVAFGGVVDAGESVVAAAVRELGEEAGVRVEPSALSLLAEGRYEDELIREIGTVYLAVHDGPFHFDDGEVVDDARIPFADLGRWSDSRDLCDDSAALVLPLVLERVANEHGGIDT